MAIQNLGLSPTSAPPCICNDKDLDEMIINMMGVICIFCHALAMMNIRNGPHKICDKQSVNTTKLQLRLSELGLTVHFYIKCLHYLI